jgi:hypothetical protein
MSNGRMAGRSLHATGALEPSDVDSRGPARRWLCAGALGRRTWLEPGNLLLTPGAVEPLSQTRVPGAGQLARMAGRLAGRGAGRAWLEAVWVVAARAARRSNPSRRPELPSSAHDRGLRGAGVANG